MTVSAANGSLLSGLSAIDGISLSTLAAINGQLKGGCVATPTGAITWTNVVNATVGGSNELVSTAGSFTSGASSVEQVGSCGGRIIFPVSALVSQGARIIGLSNTDVNQHFSTILFAIDQFDNRTFVFESGSSKGEFANVIITDTYEIRVSAAGVVTYYINGGLIYTSLTTATFPLIVDATIGDSGKTMLPPTTAP